MGLDGRVFVRFPNQVTGAEASSYSTVLSSAISEGLNQLNSSQ